MSPARSLPGSDDAEGRDAAALGSRLYTHAAPVGRERGTWQTIRDAARLLALPGPAGRACRIEPRHDALCLSAPPCRSKSVVHVTHALELPSPPLCCGSLANTR